MIGMADRYDDVLASLRQAYDTRAVWRDGLSKEPWKLAERQLLGFATGARFDVMDLDGVDTGRGYRFQSLTLCRPA